jgi:hypothetical protein
MKKSYIKKVSKKMGKTTRSYSKQRIEFLLNNPMCHAKIFNCTLGSTEIHHKKGRDKYHLDIDTWLAVCRNCHNWIEHNPEEAIELGYSQNKF